LVYQKLYASSAVYLQLETVACDHLLDLLLTPPATDLPSPVKRILQLDEEQDVTSRLEEVRAVLALHHSATVLTPVRKSCQNSSRPWIGWRRAGEH
jgi:hypothetical protein